MSRFTKPQAGVTLIELLVAIGIGTVVIYVVASVLWQGTKETQSLTAKNELNSLVDNIQVRLNNPAKCQEMFSHQFTAPINKTIVPDLDKLGPPGPGTTPIPVTLDMGNVDSDPLGVAKHQGVAVYSGGMKLGPELTIMNLELMGKKAAALDVNGNAIAQKYEIPLHIVVSRRIGGYVTVTATDTATGSVTKTQTTASGSETATGGDTIQKTIIMKVSMDFTGKRIIGCGGQSLTVWQLSDTVQKSLGNPVTTPSLNIVFTGPEGKGGGGSVGIGQDPLIPDPADASKTLPFPNSAKWKLDVNGPIQARGHSDLSDARLKENVRDIPKALDRVESLHGVNFAWKDAPEAGDQVGFLAQEVEKVFPEVVQTAGNDGPKSVAYESLLAPMVEAIKERQKILDQQERDLAAIRQSLRKTR